MDPREEILRGKGIDPTAHYKGGENEEEKPTPHSGAAGAASAVDPFGPAAIMDDETRAILASRGVQTAEPGATGRVADVAPSAATSVNKEFVTALLSGKPTEGAKNKPEDEITTISEEEDEGVAEGEGAVPTKVNLETPAPPSAGDGPQPPIRSPITFSIQLYGQREPLIKFDGFWTGKDIRIVIRHMWRGYRLHKRDMLLKGTKR